MQPLIIGGRCTYSFHVANTLAASFGQSLEPGMWFQQLHSSSDKTGLSSHMSNAQASAEEHEPGVHAMNLLSDVSRMVFKDLRNIQVDAGKVTLCHLVRSRGSYIPLLAVSLFCTLFCHHIPPPSYPVSVP